MSDRPLSDGEFSLPHSWMDTGARRQNPHRWRVLEIRKSIQIPPTLMAVDDASDGSRTLRRRGSGVPFFLLLVMLTLAEF